MKKLALLLMLFTQLSSALAFGQFAIRLEIENELEQKATRVLRSYDPHAFARVSVQLKKINAVLPGTDSVIENLVETKSKNVLSEQDIESVTVIVTYAEANLQETAASSLQNALGLKASQIKIEWKPFEATALQSLKNKDTGSQVERLLLDLKQLIWVVAGSVLGLAIIGLGCAVLMHRSSSKRSHSQFENLIRALGENKQVEERPVLELGNQEKAPGLPAPHDSNSPIKQLENKALLALMTDCYWCEEDEYASWLWQQSTYRQKEFLLQTWEPCRDYVESLLLVSPKPRTDHEHPIYLSPPPLAHLSQADLQVFVDQHPRSLLMLSPMRRNHLRISIENKLRILSEGAGSELPAWPSTISPARSLRRQTNVGQVQLEEEEMILQSPEMIPVEMRVFFPSLVWTKFLAVEDKKDLLSRYSAQDLAHAWLGPVQLLEDLEMHLPEKKRNLLKGYLRQVRPDKSTPTYHSLVREVFEKLERKSISA